VPTKEQDGTVSIIPTTFNPNNWTNANKVQIAAFINAIIALVIGFGLSITLEQMGLLMAAVNAGLALFGGATANNSPVALALKRHVTRRKSGGA
jgi:hypothetical protein